MNNYIDQLVISVLQKESLEQCTIQELKQLATDYPYFSAAQLLLAKKLQIENSEEYEEQVEKTSLFFNNPFWLDHLLNEKGEAEIEEREPLEITQPINHIEPAHVEEISPGKIEIDKPVIAETAVVGNTRPEPFKEEPVNTNTELLFEPYHTVDYFASQGIRFREEEKPTDKFGQQLKSFTEWLKTLKRLPVSEIAKNTEPVAEQKVEQMAEASLTEREVITETMAEVWQKQGNREKAIEIYNKLSLLEPSKSAYFAAKIEELRK